MLFSSTFSSLGFVFGVLLQRPPEELSFQFFTNEASSSNRSNFTTTVGRSTAIDFDDNYLVNVTIGGQEFLLIADTGTSSCDFGTAASTLLHLQPSKSIPMSTLITPSKVSRMQGDSLNTGIMGLASPNLTKVYKDFSIALNRGSFETGNNSLFDPNLGFIAFEELRPFPLQNKHLPLFQLRSPNAFAAAIDPPAIMDGDSGIYVTSCNATVPEYTVNIAVVTFTVDPADSLIPAGLNDEQMEVHQRKELYTYCKYFY
ncbi:hypothetical protein BDP27DRAFT_1371259 [Rhodocollybia butyracea]|uniref:Peptidase A1 domain-containing protein n=1 Tax=Rhodocollybia butyracea TaxID=206335 RepID=A0A9P5PAA7_9AGAR|nr:hypothetical protein BDP27DRAFT_1371259 [Rhodocollybia butyracea]